MDDTEREANVREQIATWQALWRGSPMSHLDAKSLLRLLDATRTENADLRAEIAHAIEQARAAERKNVAAEAAQICIHTEGGEYLSNRGVLQKAAERITARWALMSGPAR